MDEPVPGEEKQDIEAVVSMLIGQALSAATRDLNELVLHFGEMRSRNYGGEPQRIMGAAILRIFCAWRILDGPKIVVGSGNYSTPTDPAEDPIRFDWSLDDSTFCDRALKTLLTERTRDELIVTSVSADRFGSLDIGFATGLTLEIFPHTATSPSFEADHWRLQLPDISHTDFVVTTYGVGVEVEDE